MKALQNGVEFGRKAILSDEHVEVMRRKRQDGVLIKNLMAEYGLSKASVYRPLKSPEPVLQQIPLFRRLSKITWTNHRTDL